MTDSQPEITPAEGPEPLPQNVPAPTDAQRKAPAELDPQLVARFAKFAEVCSEFSKDILTRSGLWTGATIEDHTRMNLEIAQTVFSKWTIDIITCLFAARVARFQEIKNIVGEISRRVLSVKLARLEELGLVHRAVIDTRPPRVEYSLTPKGLRVATLGEPVFLYLRLTEGLTAPPTP